MSDVECQSWFRSSGLICKRSSSESIQLKSPPKIKSPGDRKKVCRRLKNNLRSDTVFGA